MGGSLGCVRTRQGGREDGNEEVEGRTHEIPQQDLHEPGAATGSHGVVLGGLQSLHMVKVILESHKPLGPFQSRRRILVTEHFQLANHPGQWYIAHLVGVELPVLCRLEVEMCPPKILDSGPETLSNLSLRLFLADRGPAAANISVVARKPDFFDVFVLAVAFVKDVLVQESSLELDTELVGGDCMADVLGGADDGHGLWCLAEWSFEDGNATDAVEDAEEVDLHAAVAGLVGVERLVAAAECASEGIELVSGVLGINIDRHGRVIVLLVCWTVWAK